MVEKKENLVSPQDILSERYGKKLYKVKTKSFKEDEKDDIGAGVGAQFDKTVGKVVVGDKPKKEEDIDIQEKREQELEEQAKEREERKEEIREVPVTELEKQELAAQEAIRLLKTQTDLDTAKVDFLEKQIQNQFKLRQLTDPATDPMVDFDTRQKAANERLRDAFKEGRDLIIEAGRSPQPPRLNDEGINAKQAAITLGLQSLTGIMGAVSGRPAGLEAARVAGQAGAEEIVANVGARRQANANLMAAYNQSVSKSIESTQKFVTAYMKEVGASGRKEMEEYTDHWKNIEDVATARRLASLEETKTKLSKMKMTGDITDAQFKASIDSIEKEQASIDNFRKRINEYWKTSVTAQKANQLAAIKKIQFSQEELKRKGFKFEFQGLASFLSETPKVATRMNELTTTPVGRNKTYKAFDNMSGYNLKLGGLDTIYSVEELMSDKEKMKDATLTISALTRLLTFIDSTGKVPMSVDINELSELRVSGSGKQINFYAIPGFQFRDAYNEQEQRVAQTMTINKINLLAAQQERARTSIERMEQRRITGETSAEQAIRKLGALRGESPRKIEKKVKKFRETGKVGEE